MNAVKAWYLGLQERERSFVVIGAIALGLLLLFLGLILPLQSAVTQAQSRLATKRADLAWMQSHAAEIIAAGDIGAAPAGESPIVLVDRTGREAGLASALRGTQPNGAAGVRVQLEGAPFDTLVRWLAVLEQRHGLAIESITVDRSAGSGLVNASVNFAQPKP